MVVVFSNYGQWKRYEFRNTIWRTPREEVTRRTCQKSRYKDEKGAEGSAENSEIYITEGITEREANISGTDYGDERLELQGTMLCNLLWCEWKDDEEGKEMTRLTNTPAITTSSNGDFWTKDMEKNS